MITLNPRVLVRTCLGAHGTLGAMMIFDARSASSPRTTGWERYTRAIAVRLERSGDVQLWSPDVRTLGRRLTSDVCAARLPRSAYVHFPTFPPVAPARYARLVLTMHDLTWWRFPETASRLGALYYRPLLERALPRAHAVVTHSATVRREVIERFGLAEERVHVVSCGADSLPEHPDAQGSSRRKPFLLVVGSVEPRKNLSRLTTAFQKSGMGNEYDLVIVGRAAWGEVPRGVEVLHGVDDLTLSQLYRDAVAVVLPSLYEGFGLPIVEALAAGTPVICSDIPVFREVAGDDASYFDPLSVGDMVNSLRKLDPGRTVPEDVRSRIRSTYTWDNVAARLSRVYDGL